MSETIPMDQVGALHRRAMELCDRAIEARSFGDGGRATALFRESFDAESRAASLVAGRLDLEPTRSILLRSAATLALDCSEFRAAERLIATALAGNPPPEIAGELRDLFAGLSGPLGHPRRGRNDVSDSESSPLLLPRIAPGNPTMIEVADVTKSYRSGDRTVEALRGVTARIPRGCFAFIVGPSGSGKSTLLYLLGALDRPTSGRIVVAGHELTAMSESATNEYRRDKIGFIFQAFNLLSNLTAVENVVVPFLPRGVSPELKERAAELLREVGLGARIDHRPYQLSGGEQQRVAIARALVKDPDVVLADEPTGELDSKSAAEVYRILRRLQAEKGTTLVVVTHDRRFIKPDDLVLEIQDGQLVDGALDPQHDLSKAPV